MLNTKLDHLTTEEGLKETLQNNENVVVVCGRMGPMCIPVYATMDQLRDRYPQVQFYDLEFDIPAANFIKRLPECASFAGLPFTVYFHEGKAVAATTSIQTRDQIIKILDQEFSPSLDAARSG